MRPTVSEIIVSHNLRHGYSIGGLHGYVIVGDSTVTMMEITSDMVLRMIPRCRRSYGHVTADDSTTSRGEIDTCFEVNLIRVKEPNSVRLLESHGV